MTYTIIYYKDGKKFTEDFPGTEADLRAFFAKEGRVIVSMKPSRRVGRKVAEEEVHAFLSASADMTKSGAPLSKAIEAVLQSSKGNSRMKTVLTGILQQISEGKDLSKAMEAYSDVFGHTVLCMVTAGENTGKLGNSLSSAAEYMRTMSGTTKELYKKLAYPVFMLVVGIGSLLANTMYTIPKIMSSDLFKLVKVPKDNIYILLLNSIAVIVPVVIVAVVLGLILLSIYYRLNQLAAEKYFLKVPAIRSLVFYRGYYVAFYSLAELVAADVRLDTALEIARASVTSKTLQVEFDSALHHLREGESFVDGFNSLTTIERTMLEVAVGNGKIEENLRLVAKRYYESMVEEIRKISPKVYAFTMLLIVSIFFLMLMGIMVPYGKILGGIRL